MWRFVSSPATALLHGSNGLRQATEPRDNFSTLPAELLVETVKYLEVKDVLSVILLNHRLHERVSPILWEMAMKVPDPRNARLGRKIVFWAVENGHHQLLQYALANGANPNPIFLSPILASRIADVLTPGQSIHADQSWVSTNSPADPLELEIIRASLCTRNAKVVRDRLIVQRKREGLSTDLGSDIAWCSQECHEAMGRSRRARPPASFGTPFRRLTERFIDDVQQDREANFMIKRLWHWSPIHLAAQRGDNEAVNLLISYGANIDALCSGLCDCPCPELTPGMDYYDAVGLSIDPASRQMLWSPLHMAICHGHASTVQLLLERNAHPWIGRFATTYYWPRAMAVRGENKYHRISAFDYAAWTGAAELFSILWDYEKSREREGNLKLDEQIKNSLNYAAAAGHLRTIGKLLHDKDATRYRELLRILHTNRPSFRLDFIFQSKMCTRSLLEILCAQHLYEDAKWLLKEIERVEAITANLVAFGTNLSLALGRLCSFEPPKHDKLNLREQQDYFLRSTEAPSLSEQELRFRNTEDDRLLVARELLRLGAYPKSVVRRYDPTKYEWSDMSSFSRAERSQFHRMLNLFNNYMAARARAIEIAKMYGKG